MLYREIIAVFSQIHTKHINTLCGQNVEFVSVKPIDTQSAHWGLRDNFCILINIYLHNKKVKYFKKLGFNRLNMLNMQQIHSK